MITGKTKRQLRAEAVERLKMFQDARDPIFNSDIGAAVADGDLDKAIYMLTDDEPPEGDAVNILRSWASFWSVAHSTHTECDSNWEVTTMRALADMVERDYVRRDAVQEVMDEDTALVVENAELKTNNACLHRLASAQADKIDELIAERDEWKAKAEKLLDETRGLWGFWRDPDANDACTENDTVGAHSKAQSKDAPTSSDLHGVMSDDCVRNDALAPENGVSAAGVDANDGNADSREKLEADVQTYLDLPANCRNWGDFSAVCKWLDRQAAITTAECERICDECAWPEYDRLAELQAKVDGLERERDLYRAKLGEAMDLAHEIGRLAE